MIFDLVIKNGNTFVDSKIKKLNVGILDSNIVSIFDSGNFETRNTIDAENQFVLPGFIDVHFHVRSPSYPERGTVETETRAAAAGSLAACSSPPRSRPARPAPASQPPARRGTSPPSTAVRCASEVLHPLP